MKTNARFFLLTAAFAWLACMVIAIAQTNTPSPGSVSPGAFATAQFWIDLVTPFIGPVLTAVVKKIMPSLPPALIPPLAVGLGVVSNALGTVAIGADVAVWKAVALGLAGIGVREAQDQVKKAILPPETLIPSKP